MTSDGGLLVVCELDERLGLTGLIQNYLQRLVPQSRMDSTEIPVYGQQEHSAYKRHFACSVYRSPDYGNESRLHKFMRKT